MFRLVTSMRSGRAPESWAVLKKIGAITPPMITPPRRLFGTAGMSSPIHQRTLLQADLREEPVPTTSPTKATWWPSSRHLAISSMPPGKRVLPMARACSGISGRLQASPAGEKSSVLISPSTLNTFTVTVSGISGLLVNHSAFAQDSTTFLAAALLLARS